MQDLTPHSCGPATEVLCPHPGKPHNAAPTLCGHGANPRAKVLMKIPQRLQPLIEDGLADSVVRQLMSGKEAMVYVVRCGDGVRCA